MNDMPVSPTPPTFTLEHEEQTWRVQVQQGNKDYAIYLTRFGTGKVTLTQFKGGYVDQQNEGFVFEKSDPNVVLAIGRLLVAAARKAGAMDA